jgi:hypothetical protein
MIHPHRNVTVTQVLNVWASVTPTVAEQITVTGYDHVLAGCVSHTDKCLGAHHLPVLIKADGCLDLTGGVD